MPDDAQRLAEHIRAWALEESPWNVGSILSDLGSLDDDDLLILAAVIRAGLGDAQT